MKKLLKSVAALSLSAMMLLSPGVLAEEDEEESNVVELTTVVQEYEGKQIVLKTAGLDILEHDTDYSCFSFFVDVSDNPTWATIVAAGEKLRAFVERHFHAIQPE